MLSRPPVHSLLPSGDISTQLAPSVWPWNCLSNKEFIRSWMNKQWTNEKYLSPLAGNPIYLLRGGKKYGWKSNSLPAIGTLGLWYKLINACIMPERQKQSKPIQKKTSTAVHLTIHMLPNLLYSWIMASRLYIDYHIKANIIIVIIYLISNITLIKLMAKGGIHYLTSVWLCKSQTATFPSLQQLKQSFESGLMTRA